MSAFPAPLFQAGAQFFINTGVVNAGGRLAVYAAGSVTPSDTWTDASQTVKNANPILLDSAGRVTQAVWLQSGLQYKFQQQTATGAVLGPALDFVSGINDAIVSQSQWIATGVTPVFANATTFTLPGDQTLAFQYNRRTQASVTSGTVYGSILSSVYNGSITTVTQLNDAGALDSGLSAVNLGLISATNTSIPSSVGGGAKGTGVVYENYTTISQNYTMTLNKNGFSVGPVTINTGVVVTVPTGQRWVIL